MIPALILCLGAGAICENLFYRVVASFILFLPCIFMTKCVRRYLLVISIPMLLMGGLDLVYAYVFKSKLKLEILSTIFESNPGESTEFLSMYAKWDVVGIIVGYVVVAYIFIYFSRPVANRLSYLRRGVGAFTLIITIGLPPVLSGNYIQYLSYNNTLKPILYFSKYKIDRSRFLKAHEKRKGKVTFKEITSKYSKDQKETYVFVIGESLSRHHLSLYGYKRDTNPRLSKRNLTIFKDTIAAYPVTVEAIKTLVSFGTRENMEPYYNKGSIIDFFNDAGFQTFWFSNQQSLPSMQTAVTVAAENADVKGFLNSTGMDVGRQSYDEKLLSPLRAALVSPGNKKFIVLHMLGSHMSYNMRYPGSFKDRFLDQPIYSKYADLEWEKKLVNEFDNSVLYNDYILDRVVEMLKEDKGVASMVYTTDHGEDVFDTIDFAGHVDTSDAVFEVPLVMWTSRKFKALNSRIVKNLDLYAERPYQTDRLIHTLIDLAGLSSPDFDARASILGPSFVPKAQRTVGDRIYHSK